MKLIRTRVGSRYVVDANADGTPELVVTEDGVEVADTDAMTIAAQAAAAGVLIIVSDVPFSPPGTPDTSLQYATIRDVTAYALAAIAPTATASATLGANRHTPVDATGNTRTMTLPTDAPAGALISVEKTDASSNAVTITGKLRGVATQSIPLTSQYEVRTFLSEGAGSWRPISDHRTKTSLDAAYGTYFNVKAYGAKGDGVTDDTAAVQRAIDAAAAWGRKTKVVIEGSCKVTTVTLTAALVDIEGPGTLVGGKLVIGTATNVVFQSAIRNVRFEQTGRVAGTSGIELYSVQNLEITGCYFTGMDAAVRKMPFAGGAGIGTGAQHTTRLRINHNRMWDVNYAFQTRNDASDQWLTMADVDFIGNVILHRAAGLDVEACDGLKILDNTFFTQSYSAGDTQKTQNILLGKTNWLVIANNNLFEAGFEAIKLTDPQNVTITGNNVAWCGQRASSDAVNITLSTGIVLIGIVSGNNFGGHTGNVVSILGSGNASGFTFGVNSYFVETLPAFYYGGTALPATRYRYFSANTLVSQPPTVVNAVRAIGPVSGDQLNNQTTESRNLIGTYSTMNSRGIVKTFTPAQAVVVTGFTGKVTSTAYSGLIHITAVSITDIGRTASYVVSVAGNVSRSITTMAGNGAVAGATANDPSFTFSLNTSDQLVATAVGATAGSFAFYLTSIGNVLT